MRAPARPVAPSFRSTRPCINASRWPAPGFRGLRRRSASLQQRAHESQPSLGRSLSPGVPRTAAATKDETCTSVLAPTARQWTRIARGRRARVKKVRPRRRETSLRTADPEASARQPGRRRCSCCGTVLGGRATRELAAAARTGAAQATGRVTAAACAASSTRCAARPVCATERRSCAFSCVPLGPHDKRCGSRGRSARRRPGTAPRRGSAAWRRWSGAGSDAPARASSDSVLAVAGAKAWSILEAWAGAGAQRRLTATTGADGVRRWLRGAREPTRLPRPRRASRRNANRR